MKRDAYGNAVLGGERVEALDDRDRAGVAACQDETRVRVVWDDGADTWEDPAELVGPRSVHERAVR